MDGARNRSGHTVDEAPEKIHLGEWFSPLGSVAVNVPFLVDGRSSTFAGITKGVVPRRQLKCGVAQRADRQGIDSGCASRGEAGVVAGCCAVPT